MLVELYLRWLVKQTGVFLRYLDGKRIGFRGHPLALPQIIHHETDIRSILPAVPSPKSRKTLNLLQVFWEVEKILASKEDRVGSLLWGMPQRSFPGDLGKLRQVT